MPEQTRTPDENLCFALYAASHAMSRLYRALLSPLGLTYPQYLVLLSLWSNSPQSVGSLGDAVALDSNTLTPLLKRMAQAGLVTRRRSTEDERVTVVDLTDKGRSMQGEAKGVFDCVLQATGLSGSEAAALRDEVLALRGRLDAVVTKL